jgi:hypothetical protein
MFLGDHAVHFGWFHRVREWVCPLNGCLYQQQLRSLKSTTALDEPCRQRPQQQRRPSPNCAHDFTLRGAQTSPRICNFAVADPSPCLTPHHPSIRLQHLTTIPSLTLQIIHRWTRAIEDAVQSRNPSECACWQSRLQNPSLISLILESPKRRFRLWQSAEKLWQIRV